MLHEVKQRLQSRAVNAERVNRVVLRQQQRAAFARSRQLKPSLCILAFGHPAPRGIVVARVHSKFVHFMFLAVLPHNYSLQASQSANAAWPPKLKRWVAMAAARPLERAMPSLHQCP